MHMNKIKSLYEAPTIDILVVQFEGMVCTSPGFSDSMKNEYFGYDPEEDL